MNGRYYLEIEEDGERIPIGAPIGYQDLPTARDAAGRYVDDALPRNRVRIMHQVDEAYLGGDGETYFSSGG
jgi:hypothetical protein